MLGSVPVGVICKYGCIERNSAGRQNHPVREGVVGESWTLLRSNHWWESQMGGRSSPQAGLVEGGNNGYLKVMAGRAIRQGLSCLEGLACFLPIQGAHAQERWMSSPHREWVAKAK